MIEPQPYGRTVLHNAETFVVNVPRFAPTLSPPEWQRLDSEYHSLSPLARYRINVIEAYLYRSLTTEWARWLRGQRMADFLEFYRQIAQAYARHWSLTESERETMGRIWRTEVSGGEVVLLEGSLQLPVAVAETMSTERRESTWREQRLRRLMVAMLLDELVDREGEAILGELASHLVMRVEATRGDDDEFTWYDIIEEKVYMP